MKVSVITVCKNAQDTIEETIKSIVSQTYKNIEYLIIDGKSTDKTLDIIDKYKSRINTFISEPDDGIYYAMNKGIRKSTGEIVYFLNAGDLFFRKGTVSKIVKLFKSKKVDIIYGDIILFDPHSPKNNVVKCYRHVDKVFLAHWSIYHQALFAKKSVFDKYGAFDTKYKLAADYEWLLRLIIKQKLPSLYTNQIIAMYLLGGISQRSLGRFYKERFKVLFSYFSIPQILLYNLLMKLRGRKLYFRPL